MPDTPPPPKRPSIHLHWEDGLPDLEGVNIPEAEKQQLIETLWSIVIAFVDLGWDIAPTQESSGQNIDLSVALRKAVVNSEDTHEPEKEGI